MGITDTQSGYRAYSRKALREIHSTAAGMGASTEILIKARQVNLRVVETPIVISYEGDASTHNPEAHKSNVIMSAIKLISTTNPQIFYGMLSVATLVLAVVFWIGAALNHNVTGSLGTNIVFLALTAKIIGVVLVALARVLLKRLRGGRASSQ